MKVLPIQRSQSDSRWIIHNYEDFSVCWWEESFGTWSALGYWRCCMYYKLTNYQKIVHHVAMVTQTFNVVSLVSIFVDWKRDVCLLFISSFWYFAMSIVIYAFHWALNFMVWWYPRKQWNLCSTNINEFTVYDDVYLPSYHSSYCYCVERTKPQKHISRSSYLHGH